MRLLHHLRLHRSPPSVTYRGQLTPRRTLMFARKGSEYWRGRVTAETNKLKRAEATHAKRAHGEKLTEDEQVDKWTIASTVGMQDIRLARKNYQGLANTFARKRTRKDSIVRSVSE
jgi:hypothetical protein